MDRRYAATYAGIVAPIVALGAILLATIIASPETFTWRGQALSDMGRAGTSTFVLFNGGLILGGLIGLPFGWRVWQEVSNRVERVGVAILGLSVGGMVAVGIFFLGHTDYYLSVSLHAPAAMLVFLGAPVASWVYGSGLVLAGDTRLGLASIWIGIAHILSWLVWLGYGLSIDEPSAWFAVQEFVAAVLFAGWILLLAGVILRRDRTDPAPHNA